MEFSAGLSNAMKIEACNNAIKNIEFAFYEATLNIGLLPADVADDYTAPGTATTHPLEPVSYTHLTLPTICRV